MPDFYLRMLTEKIALWTSRVEIAERSRQPKLLEKALKYKAKFEREFADFQAILDDNSSSRNCLTAEDVGCLFCYLGQSEDFLLNDKVSWDGPTMSFAMKSLGMIEADFEEFNSRTEEENIASFGACESHRKLISSFFEGLSLMKLQNGGQPE